MRIVGPVLKGAEGIAQVIEVLKELAAKGHHVNASCGVHVHVGWNREWPSEALARLVKIVAYAEKGLYAITGTKAQERGFYCGGVRKYGHDKQAKDQLERARYHALNLTNLGDSEPRTRSSSGCSPDRSTPSRSSAGFRSAWAWSSGR